MNIRPATEDDLDALVALAARTFPLACPADLPEVDMNSFIATHLSRDRFRAHLDDPQADVLIAESSEALLGYTLTFAAEPYDSHIAGLVTHRPTVELSKCYADPTSHGTGVASALISTVVAKAAAAGAASVWLGVNGQNARAQRFYAKHDFTVIGERRFVVGDRTEDDLVLERELP